MDWIKETFGTHKPIIAMCHVRALPGDPYFDADGGMEKVVDMARQEFLALQEGGVDAVMFSNEFSLPYLTKVETVTTVCMARVIGEHPLRRQYAVGSLCLSGSGCRHRRKVYP